MAAIVHLAGKLIDGKQFCTRCGMLLIDNDGAMVPVDDEHGPSRWEEGSEVANEGNAWVSVNALTDASALVMMKCK